MCRCALAIAALLVFMTPVLASKSKYYITKEDYGCEVNAVNEWSMEQAEENDSKIIGHGFKNKKDAVKAMLGMEDCRT